MVQNGSTIPPLPPMTTKTKPKEVRLTIPVTEEVHKVFQTIGEATSMPTGRAMGEWLADTIDAAKFMAEKVVQARAAPRLVAQEMHAYALGLVDETSAVLDKVRQTGRTGTGASGSPRAPGQAARSIPPSNTGVTNLSKKPGRGSR